MNRIYWSEDKITMLTDHLDAKKHSHFMLQLFLSLEGNMEILVSGKRISCKGILVNQNISHAFRAKKKLHLSVLIEPASGLAEQLNKKMKEKDYLFLEGLEIDGLQNQAAEMIEDESLSCYHKFMERLYQYMDVDNSPKQYDERIRQLFLLLDSCNCDDHRISAFAEKIA
ncbi:MAG: AraC family transcriptional regulator, partial [Lachnospiraceae bacterium]|nr:AraC family transcriptional regulator [Lachnospiraceae bacterium]